MNARTARTAAVLGAISNFVVVVLIGASLGWISGLASTPLVSVALPVLLTLITSALAAAGLIRKPAADAPPARAPAAISIYTIAIFTIGLAVGATLGMVATLDGWFVPDPARVIEGWTRWRSVVPHDEVVRRVFERTLPDPYRAIRMPPMVERPDVLLDGDVPCRAVVAKADTLGLDDLKAALRDSKVTWATAVAPIQDVETLRSVANNLCQREVSLHW